MPYPRIPDISESPNDASDVRILLIPGLAPQGPPVQEWGICGDAWQRIRDSLPVSSSIFQIDHGTNIDAKFDHHRLIDAGERLQDRLVKMCECENGKQSIILIAHSLGGTILKQALSYLKVRASSYLQYAHVLNLIAGVVYISCPHGLEDSDRLKKHVSFLLNRCAGGSLNNQSILAIDETFDIFYSIHERYSSARFRFDTLSLVESSPCNLRKTFGRNKSLRVVDQELALINNEIVITLDGDHFTICSLSDKDGQPNAVIVEKLSLMIKHSTDVVRERLRSYVTRMSQSRTPSLRTQASVEAMRKAFSATSTENHHTISLETKRPSQIFNKDMDTIFEKLAPSQLQVKLPCFMMDSDFAQNADFFGRQDVLNAIEKHLLPSSTGTARSIDPAKLSIAVLCGMAGLGKTEIAMQFVFMQRKKFDAVFWLCAENESKLETDFCQIAVELGLQDGNEQATPVITRNKVKEWLSNPQRVINGSDYVNGLNEAHWLLVFDNADSPAILRDYLQIYGRGSILVTSRDPSARYCHPDAEIFNLNPFEEEESRQFLNLLTKQTSCSGGDRRVADHLAGLPLAIAQMAGVIREQFLRYEDLLESLDNPRERLEIYNTKEGGINKTARGDMTSIWTINKLTADAKLLIEVISFLFPDRIPDDLLLERNSSGLIIPMSRPEFYKARAQLLHLSLIRHNDAKRDIWIHRVPRQVVRANIDDPTRLKAFSCALELVTAAWPRVEFEKRHNKATVPARERLVPHVMSLKDFYQDEWELKEPKTDFMMASLLHETAWFMYERGNFGRARPLSQLGLEIANSPTLRTDRSCPSLKSFLHDTLGWIANTTNMPEDSMSHNTELLKLRKDITAESGNEDLPLGYAYNQMGCAWMIAKDYQKGRELYTEALHIWNANPNFKKGLACMEYANLGLCHLLLGETDQASKVLEKGQQEREEGFGRDNPESFKPGRILHALGNVRASQKRFDESEEYHQRALELYLKVAGPQYHRVADMCHKLAQACLRRGDSESLSKALKLVNQALSIWSADKKAYKPEIARTTFFKSKITYQIASHYNDSEVAAGEDLELFNAAVSMYADLVPQREKLPEELAEADFDELVMFWSR